MRSHLTILAVSLGGLLGMQGTLGAQVVPPIGGNVGPAGPFGPMSRPVLSPYLNILGFGNPAVNYFNQTNRQFDQRAFDQQILQQAPVSMATPLPDLDDLIP